MTTGVVTEAARSWVGGKPRVIWDGDDLARLAKGAEPWPAAVVAAVAEAGGRPSYTFRQAQAAPSRPVPAPAPTQAAGICPRCGAALVVRHQRKTGQAFLGCSQFPRCRHIEPLRS